MNPHHAHDSDNDDVPRRGFLARATAVVAGAITCLVPLGASLGFLLNPVLRRTTGNSDDADGSSGFFSLGIRPEALPEDGTPQSFKVLANKTDQWNFYPNQEIGSVWLRRLPDNQIIAFSTTCPHLGCHVDYRKAQSDFFCPCHFSSFNLQGARQNSIPPRNMDTLEVTINEDGIVCVAYKEFRGACKEKIPS